jgi:endogenous inhibitor of DNA gyrase (YacG/DUF329 family)
MHSATCVHCGSVFTRNRPIRGITCSRICRAQKFKAKADEQRTCKACGNTFLTKPSSKVRFCSIGCFNRSSYRGTNNKEPMTRKCKHCGKEYRRVAGQLNRRFCSHKCAVAANHGSKQHLLGLFKKGRTNPNRGNAATIKKSFPYCQRCGWRDEPVVLHVHHKDRNRLNQAIANLEVLCPNCHCTEHYRTGDWFRNLSFRRTS